MIRVLLVDDHTLVREGIRRILETAPDIEVVAEAADGIEAIRASQSIDTDVVIVDITMPNLDGIEVTKQIHAETPTKPILVLSVHATPLYANRLMTLGASGYVPKQAASHELIEAVRTVYAGKKYIARELESELASYQSMDASYTDPINLLTNRELQVTRLLALGKSSVEVSHSLGLSVKTVNAHRLNILGKLRLRNNSELTRFAISSRLLEEP